MGVFGKQLAHKTDVQFSPGITFSNSNSLLLANAILGKTAQILELEAGTCWLSGSHVLLYCGVDKPK